MKSVRTFAVDNELARLAREPGGRTVKDAVRAAEVRVEAQRDVTVASLSVKAEQMAAIAAAGKRGEDANCFTGIYDLSNAIYGLASSFGLKGLAEASFSLCDLADGFRSGETVNWPAIDVHVDGIRLLAALGTGAGEAGAESILEGLRRVRQRVLPKP